MGAAGAPRVGAGRHPGAGDHQRERHPLDHRVRGQRHRARPRRSERQANRHHRPQPGRSSGDRLYPAVSRMDHACGHLQRRGLSHRCHPGSERHGAGQYRQCLLAARRRTGLSVRRYRQPLWRQEHRTRDHGQWLRPAATGRSSAAVHRTGHRLRERLRSRDGSDDRQRGGVRPAPADGRQSGPDVGRCGVIDA